MRPRVGVIGVGLLGGSIVLTATRHGQSVMAYDVDPEAKGFVIGAGSGWAHTLQALSENVDIIVIAVPADQVHDVVTDLVPHLRPGQILTDVSSTKTSPTTALSTAPTGVRVVGGHPLAGTTPGGRENASGTLFDGCVWVLCPTDGETVPSELSRMIVGLGAGQILVCSAEEHDRAVASISHGVQAASTAIAAAVNSIVAEDRLPWLLAAGGWRDTTRIAEANPDVWAPILLENADNTIPVLAEIETHLARMRAALQAGDEAAVRDLIEEGAVSRERWAQLRDTAPDPSAS